MFEAFLVRQSSFIPKEETDKKKIHIVGCGAIGSILALTLVKMGIDNLVLYDDDEVNDNNIGNQFYRISDIGTKKVIALKDILVSFGAEESHITPVEARFDVSSFNEAENTILISAVDNMKTRIDIYQSLKMKKIELRPEWYIETRMALQEFRVFLLKNDMEAAWLRYDDELYESSEAVREACTERSIMFTPMGVANIIGKTISNIIRKEEINFYGFSYDIKEFTLFEPRTNLYRTKAQKKKVIEFQKQQEEEVEIEE